MKKHIMAAFWLMANAGLATAQLPNGSIAPDFTATDLDGNQWHLYDLLDQGKSVVIDISATWCGPCWSYHQTGNLETLHELYGPGGTGELVVLFIEGDPATTIDQLHGIGPGTQGDWTAGTPYPICDAADVADLYLNAYFPTIYVICPNRLVAQIGQAGYQQIHDLSQSCAKTSGANNAAVLAYLGPSGNFCENQVFSPAFHLQNMGSAPLQSAKLELLIDGTTVQTIQWTGSLNSYQLEKAEFSQITVDKAAQLDIRTSEPNGQPDDSPGNDKLGASFTVAPSTDEPVLDLEINFDQFPLSVYWEMRDANGNLLYFGGNPLAKYPSKKLVKEYPTPNATVHHALGLPGSGCYEFSIYDIGGNGICCDYGLGSYRLRDAQGNILVEGSDFGGEKTDPFGLHNSAGAMDNATILSLEPLDDDFCDQYPLNPTVTVRNSGANKITSLNFDVSGNGGLYKSHTWNGSLAPGAEGTISLGEVTVTTTDDLKISLTKVNGQADFASFRNSVSKHLTQRQTPKASWIVDIITDYHGYETYWQLEDDMGAVLASGGNQKVGPNGGGLGVSTAADPGAYAAYQHIQQTVNLSANGCYHFLVADDKGDGMELNGFGFPTAYARIRNPQMGIITGSDGDFFEEYRSNIGLAASVGTGEWTSTPGIEVFPNPASREVWVNSTRPVSSAALFNQLGQRVWAGVAIERPIPLDGFSTGVYFLEIQFASGERMTHRVIVVE